MNGEEIKMTVRDIIGNYGGYHGFAEHFGISPRSAYRYMQWGFFSKETAYRLAMEHPELNPKDLMNPKHNEQAV